MPALSLLDLARIREGSGAKQALDEARALAGHAEALGYSRYWLAEHHNMAGIASAATSLAIQHVAAGTRTIRIGAGGVMLPNHAPIVIAEQFGTLAALFPGRIDLGLGRAPGTDGYTMRALRRSLQSDDDFPRDVQELQYFFSAEAAEGRVQAVPAAGTNVPIWILGSSTYGARLAAELGLPYGFASHFAPDLLLPALDTYRRNFKPSATLAKPYALIGVNVIAAESDAEARRLATSQQMSFVNLVRGTRGLTQPPIDDIETYWTPAEKAQAGRFLERAIYGSVATVRERLDALVAETGVDELMIVSDTYDFEARKRSVALIAEAAGLVGEARAAA
ncbi:LLM class flavin-dependent oxidoreductase [Sphingomonas jatrophae]|uniref:Luciferase-like monooxygenase n=1 Tax=Sphingomonas jatrophae TaxID=1166337 RepID=A0A1I6L1T7_9SPHN|nr:LLM class flavin-dependent oxidoreductase [Sphingomonas jatrophae]SFR97411.1 luciferase family oxidoreductase, group 1 [Sphingomonas jatrophae]